MNVDNPNPELTDSGVLKEPFKSFRQHTTSHLLYHKREVVIPQDYLVEIISWSERFVMYCQNILKDREYKGKNECNNLLNDDEILEFLEALEIVEEFINDNPS